MGGSGIMEIHVMGSDQRIVRCARVSYAKDEFSDPERDKKLIRYLFKHKHASPFEHNIVAFKATKKEWLCMVENSPNPSVQVYYSGGFVWMNLRNVINTLNTVPLPVLSELKRYFPTTWAIIESRGELSDKELYSLPYTTDKAFIVEKRETSCGWVALVDRLELGTDMDYYTFIVECPLFVARQWHRHRFGSFNEVSRRYTAFGIDFYIPEKLRKQAKTNKQASLEEAIEERKSGEFLERIRYFTDECRKLYGEMVDEGVARELARGILPQFMKTRFYWTVPRIALDNFITLRTHEGAQEEIRELALAIKNMVGHRKTDTNVL